MIAELLRAVVPSLGQLEERQSQGVLDDFWYTPGLYARARRQGPESGRCAGPVGMVERDSDHRGHDGARCR